MSFNRLNYDTETYKHDINQSVGPGNYYINPPLIACKPCHPASTNTRLQRSGAGIRGDSTSIDIDSELSGLFRKHSNNPNKKYIPNCDGNDNTVGKPCGNDMNGDCNSNLLRVGEKSNDEKLTHFQDCEIKTEDTRLNNPPGTLRSSGLNRWEWLCHNPQEQIELPFEHNVNYRMIVKDNHRPIIPTPINQENALPTQRHLPCEPTHSTCASFTQPVSVVNNHCKAYLNN